MDDVIKKLIQMTENGTLQWVEIMGDQFSYSTYHNGIEIYVKSYINGVTFGVGGEDYDFEYPKEIRLYDFLVDNHVSNIVGNHMGIVMGW